MTKEMKEEKNPPKTEQEKKERYMSLFYDALEENKLLKGGRTHRLSIGGVSLEIVPSAKLSPKQVFNMYIINQNQFVLYFYYFYF